MKFWFRGHHYRFQVKHNLKSMLWLDNYNGWAWRYRHKTWLGHEDDCCDYWTPVSDPRAQRAFMLDDDLGFTSHATVSDLQASDVHRQEQDTIRRKKDSL